jgi:hypothetical protein
MTRSTPTVLSCEQTRCAGVVRSCDRARSLGLAISGIMARSINAVLSDRWAVLRRRQVVKDLSRQAGDRREGHPDPARRWDYSAQEAPAPVNPPPAPVPRATHARFYSFPALSGTIEAQK